MRCKVKIHDFSSLSFEGLQVSAIRRLGLSAVCVTDEAYATNFEVPLEGCKKENIKSYLSVQKHCSYLHNGKLC